MAMAMGRRFINTVLKYFGVAVVVDLSDAFFLGLYAVEYSVLGRFMSVEIRNPVTLKHSTRIYYLAGDKKAQLREFEEGHS